MKRTVQGKNFGVNLKEKHFRKMVFEKHGVIRAKESFIQNQVMVHEMNWTGLSGQNERRDRTVGASPCTGTLGTDVA